MKSKSGSQKDHNDPGGSSVKSIKKNSGDPAKGSHTSKNAKAVHTNSRSLISKIFGKNNDKNPDPKINEEESDEEMQDEESIQKSAHTSKQASAQINSALPTPIGSSHPSTGKPGSFKPATGHPPSFKPISGQPGTAINKSPGGSGFKNSGRETSKLTSTRGSGKPISAVSNLPSTKTVSTGNPRTSAIQEEDSEEDGMAKISDENDMNDVDKFIQNEMDGGSSPTLPMKNGHIGIDEEGREIQMVPCSICHRTFAVDRIQTHTSICANQKERQPYDIAMMRVAGTEAEDLVKAGKVKLEPAKPIPKKSVLHQQLNNSNGLVSLDPLPPIGQKSGAMTAPAKPETVKDPKSTSYQLVFDDNDDFHTRKHTKFSGFPTGVVTGKLPKKKVMDERFRSAQNSSKSDPANDYAVDSDDSDYDYLAASMTSQRTVCSDAFDFLFDSQNLNPDTLQSKLARQDSSWSAFNKEMNKKNKSNFCVIS